MPRVRFTLPAAHVSYKRDLFDESALAYMLDLHDEIEKVRVKRDIYFARGETERALEYETLRNTHIDALQVLLKDIRERRT